MKNVLSHPSASGFLRSVAIGSLMGHTLFFGSLAQAELQIDGTRVVYKQNLRDVPFAVQNISPDNPALFQSWISEYEADGNPEDSTAPFLLSPPVARLGPGGKQILRITFTGEQPDTKREAIYSLNILELPRAARDQSDSRINFAVLTRLKLFFRPSGLKGTPEKAMQQLQCKLKRTATPPTLDCDNASGFYLSFLGFQVGNAVTKGPESPSGMINPQSQASFTLNDVDKLPSDLTTLAFRFIDDIGAIVPVELVLRSD